MATRRNSARTKERNVVVPIRQNMKAVKPEVLNMMSERTEAHRRGLFHVVGTVSLIETAAGALRFPATGNIASGPTIGFVTDAEKRPDFQKFVVLTEWNGVPDLLEKSEEFCPACLAPCHVCNEKGTKNCEQFGCGGRGFTDGPGEPCPDCVAKTGKFDAACQTCSGRGEIFPPVECGTCKGTGKMVCSFCKGKTRYSTGIKGGKTDFMLGKCDKCLGAQRITTHKAQDLAPHINALMPDPVKGPIVCVGPIYSIVVDLTEEERESAGTPVRAYDILPDATGDHTFLLIDSSSTPKWPYLLAGLVQERQASMDVAPRLHR